MFPFNVSVLDDASLDHSRGPKHAEKFERQRPKVRYCWAIALMGICLGSLIETQTAAAQSTNRTNTSTLIRQDLNNKKTASTGASQVLPLPMEMDSKLNRTTSRQIYYRRAQQDRELPKVGKPDKEPGSGDTIPLTGGESDDGSGSRSESEKEKEKESDTDSKNAPETNPESESDQQEAQAEFGSWPKKRIDEVRIDVREFGEKVPEDQSANWIQTATLPQNARSQKTLAWAAPRIRYQPLYFEEPAVERYGLTKGPIRQPVVSALTFLANSALLPVKLRRDHPRSCDTPLGFARPGSPIFSHSATDGGCSGHCPSCTAVDPSLAPVYVAREPASK